jgi:hypothetical protein
MTAQSLRLARARGRSASATTQGTTHGLCLTFAAAQLLRVTRQGCALASERYEAFARTTPFGSAARGLPMLRWSSSSFRFHARSPQAECERLTKVNNR